MAEAVGLSLASYANGYTCELKINGRARLDYLYRHCTQNGESLQQLRRDAFGQCLDQTFVRSFDDASDDCLDCTVVHCLIEAVRLARGCEGQFQLYGCGKPLAVFGFDRKHPVSGNEVKFPKNYFVDAHGF